MATKNFLLNRISKKIKSTPLETFLCAIGVIVSLYILVSFAYRIITTSEMVRIQYIPDDGFYYLTLARNFFRFHTWTFDGGISRTSGFHPLFAYALTVLYIFLKPSTEAFIIIAILFCAIITAVNAIIMGVYAVKNGYVYTIVYILFVGSGNFLLNSVSLTEWPLTIVCSFFYIYFFYVFLKNPKSSSKKLFIIGLLGSLARLDFILMPCALLFAVILVRRRVSRTAAYGLAGSALGVILVFLHHKIFTGQFIPSSVLIKAYWSQYFGGGGKQVLSYLFPLMNIPFMEYYIVLFLLSCYILYFFQKKYLHQKIHTPGLIMFIGSLCTIIGYIILYSRNGAVQLWYTQNITIPAAILCITLLLYLQFVFAAYKKYTHYILRIMIIILIVVKFSQILSRQSPLAPSPNQQYQLKAVHFLKNHPLHSKIGSWSSGILGYFLDDTVINLDGLVNNDIYPYVINNNLADYIHNHHIGFLLDYKRTIDNIYFQKAGGYYNPAFIRRLDPIKRFDDSHYYWSKLTLYKVR